MTITEAEQKTILHRLVAGFNRDDLSAFDELLLSEFFDYRPYPSEPDARATFQEIGRDFRAAFSDLHIEMEALTLDGSSLRGQMKVTGTHDGSLWGAPPTRNSIDLEMELIARFEGHRCAVRWENVHLIRTLRELGVIALPENVAKKHDHPVRIPEVVYRLAFNKMRLAEKECAHLDQISITEQTTHVCEQCVATGDEWPALRLCLVCGFVGCCDLSVNKHMLAHYESTGHPIIRSIYEDDAWIWCYEENAILSSRHLQILSVRIASLKTAPAPNSVENVACGC